MRPVSVGSFLRSLVLTVVVAGGGWLLFGRGVVDDIRESNERSGGGGPVDERMVSPKRLVPAVAALRDREGADAPMITVWIRPDNVQFVLRERGQQRAWIWRDDGPLEPYNTFPGSGQVYRRPTWPLSRLDVRAPARIARSISEREGGDFLVSLGDIGRSGDGPRLFWVMRGRVGERGVAYAARADGRRVGVYDPSLPRLGAR